MNNILSLSATKALRAYWAECFVFGGKDTDPGDPARWVILLQPVPFAVAATARAMLPGKARPIHPKHTST